ncbi:MAG: ABC transporter substrate-binding protein [Steroidobacteraceae bacterium]
MSGHRVCRGFAALLAAAAVLVAVASPSAAYAATPAQPASLVDLRERTVSLSKPVRRIAIDDGRYLIALSLLLEDPVKGLAAWPRDVNRIGETTHALLLQRFPALRTVPRVASSADNFNLEAMLAAAPDVAVVSMGSGPSQAQVAQLEAAGIRVVFIDFFTRPFANQERSLRILGQLTGRQAQAERFIAFREERLERISSRIAGLPPQDRPTVFLEAHAGGSGDCCNSPGRGNVGDYIEFVGGANIGADVLKGAFGKLNKEYVISRNPHVYIATGGPHLAASGGLVLGQGYDAATARASLARVAARQGISQLGAVKSGRTHGLAHQLINSPIDIVVIEAFAKWIHPELFADVDPQQTLDAINREFLAVPYEGTYWVDLPGAPQ